MRGADVLILLQLVPKEVNDLATAKVYELLAARRPVLGITPIGGTAANLLERTGTATIVGIDDPQRIADALKEFWQRWQARRLEDHHLDVSGYSRRELTGKLARIFDEALGAPPTS
jgi:hypothetical protein